MIIIYILVVLAIVIAFVITRQIIIRIDTIIRLFSVRISEIFTINIFIEDNKLMLEFRTFFYKKRIDILDSEVKETKRKKKPKKKKEEKKKKLKKKKQRKLGFAFYREIILLTVEMIWRLVKSFEIRKFYILLDTGDFAVNAKLYAIVPFANKLKIELEPNFFGKNELDLTIINYIYRLLNIIIITIIKALFAYIKYRWFLMSFKLNVFSHNFLRN